MGTDKMIDPRIGLSLAFAISAVVSTASGQNLAGKSQLVLAVRPVVEQIVPYEPLLVTVVVRNQSKHTVVFNHDYFFNDLVFWYAREDKPFVRCAYGKSSVMFSGIYSDGAPGDLRPGHEQGQDELLFWRHPEQFNGKAFVFSQAGKYRIKAKARNLESNVVEVTVKQPSAKDTGAARLFTRPRVARFIQGAFLELKEERKKVMAELQEALVKHPRAPFADYANYRLAMALYLSCLRASDKSKVRAEAYKRFAAVSGRIPMLRTRAACLQAYLLRYNPRFASPDDYVELRKTLSTAVASEDPFLQRTFSLSNARAFLRALASFYFEDPRLDRKIHYRFAKGTTFGEWLKEVSEQSGVPLDADPVARAVIYRVPSRGSGSVREFMSQYSGGDQRCWEARGDGYHLSTERERRTRKRNNNKVGKK